MMVVLTTWNVCSVKLHPIKIFDLGQRCLYHKSVELLTQHDLCIVFSKIRRKIQWSGWSKTFKIPLFWICDTKSVLHWIIPNDSHPNLFISFVICSVCSLSVSASPVKVPFSSAPHGRMMWLRASMPIKCGKLKWHLDRKGRHRKKTNSISHEWNNELGGEYPMYHTSTSFNFAFSTTCDNSSCEIL